MEQTIEGIIEAANKSSDIIKETMAIVRRWERQNSELMAQLKATMSEDHDCKRSAEDGCDGCPTQL